MRKTAWAAAGMAFLIMAGAAVLEAAHETAPDFTLVDLEGNKITLAGLKGKVIFINFWATWCGPCRVEIPDFIEFYDEYKDRGIEIIGVSVDRSMDMVVDFVRVNNVNYPVAMVTRQIMGDYKPGRFIPTTVVINPAGKIVDKKIGVMDKGTLERYFKEYFQ